MNRRRDVRTGDGDDQHGLAQLVTDNAPAEPEAKEPARQSGTLFERMSNIARGAAKAQVEEEPAPRMRSGRESLDIPRFLNRQNNQ